MREEFNDELLGASEGKGATVQNGLKKNEIAVGLLFFLVYCTIC